MTIHSRGEATSSTRAVLRDISSRSVRYADPITWTVTAAIARAIANCDFCLENFREEIGIITVSATAPAQTISDIADAMKSGFSSPLRFPAASPCTLVGVACIAYGFRGPTLNLAMPCSSGMKIALCITEQWICHRDVPFVILATFSDGGPCGPCARSVVVGGNSSDSVSSFRSVEDARTWLSQSDQLRKESPGFE
jgi:hypothetical protein